MAKVKLLRAEFMVEGDEDYYVCEEHKRTRIAVADVISKIILDNLAKLNEILHKPGEPVAKYAKLVLRRTGKKPLIKKWLNPSKDALYDAEDFMLDLQHQFLVETRKV